MRTSQFLIAIASCLTVWSGALAAEPVVVEIVEQGTVGTAVVTIADVARVSGGDAAVRDRVASIDVAELRARDLSAVVGRRSVEYRLQLAGLGKDAVRLTGAERATVVAARRAITVEEVTTAGRTELLRQLGQATDSVSVELAQPLSVKLPEVFAKEPVSITAKPRGRPAVNGRVQMDMAVSVRGETLLSFAIHLDVKPVDRLGNGVMQTGGTATKTSTEVLVRARQRVEVSLQTGGLKVVMLGEAQQDGRLGQTVLVQNLDSKKTVAAKVVGSGKLEVELGGTP